MNASLYIETSGKDNINIEEVYIPKLFKLFQKVAKLIHSKVLQYQGSKRSIFVPIEEEYLRTSLTKRESLQVNNDKSGCC